ncbi:MAG: hypothetical protein ACAI44_08975 [Candidatus Sericytochromatia bacterium]
MSLLILEGLTGAGKSSTLAELKTLIEASGQRLKIFYEEESFGELMEELAVAGGTFAGLCHRLEEILERLPELSADWVILERFHPSYYALCPDWELYRQIDDRLAQLQTRLVLLSYPEALAHARALYRSEREAEGWSAGFIARYGSETLALDALHSSLRLRAEAVSLSRLQTLTIDTSDQDWQGAARRILDWAAA